MVKLFDTHAHLDSPKLRGELDEVLAKAAEYEVQRIVTIGASRGMASNQEALALASAHDFIRCTTGVHPHEAADADEAFLALVRELSTHEQVVGIGETGLDYYYDYSPREVQQEVFRTLLALSAEVGKPVIIHSRDAEEDTVRLIKESGVTGGILHCFSGSRAFAEAVIELDFYVSFSGIVTFKSARELLEIARDVPADRLLIETDAPYLAPVPMRGKRNQPAFVRHTAEAIAEIRGLELEQLAALTWENASRVFNWV